MKCVNRKLLPLIGLLLLALCWTLGAQDKAVDYLRRANDAYDRKAWDSALADYNRTIELAPQHASGYLGRGNVKTV